MGIAAALARLLDAIREEDVPASVRQAADEADYALRAHRQSGAERVARHRSHRHAADYYDGRDGSLEITRAEEESYVEEQDRLMREARNG